MTFEVDLKGLCDANGFLTHQGSWNEDIACRLARAEGIELLDAHWEVISLLQAFYTGVGFTLGVAAGGVMLLLALFALFLISDLVKWSR